jgi:hypothetical protein
VTEAVRRAGYDIVIADEVGNARASDDEHLQWAAARQLTVVTYDRKDFPRLSEEWLAGRSHAGIVVSVAPPALPHQEIVQRHLPFLDSVTADGIFDPVRWLDPAP